MKIIILATLCFIAYSLFAQDLPADNVLFNMNEIGDVSTLEVEVIDDWHTVEGTIATRQKYITINVGEVWEGQDYRIPVRFIVPAKNKAAGFHLTGGHNVKNIKPDFAINRPIDKGLINQGIGLVHTVVQAGNMSGVADLQKQLYDKFIETLNPHYSIQYWAWPASIMRSITAAYAEKEYFSPGNIAVSGGSKNGASPSVSIINDKRITALHATVSPIWESPLRLVDKEAHDALAVENQNYVQKLIDAGENIDPDPLLNHVFSGGNFGPSYIKDALNAGHSWEALQQLARQMADYIFISKNLEQLEDRHTDLYFSPGTHDFVAYDMAWGGKQYPQIPVYLKANSGHGQTPHPAAEKDERNLLAFLFNHFFEGVDDMLQPPKISTTINDKKLLVKVKFPENSMTESGKIWWIYDRGPDGSIAYLREGIPDNNWKDMTFNTTESCWIAEIDLNVNARRIDVFSNHKRTISYNSVNYSTYISSPYRWIDLDNKPNSSF